MEKIQLIIQSLRKYILTHTQLISQLAYGHGVNLLLNFKPKNGTKDKFKSL